MLQINIQFFLNLICCCYFFISFSPFLNLYVHKKLNHLLVRTQTFWVDHWDRQFVRTWLSYTFQVSSFFVESFALNNTNMHKVSGNMQQLSLMLFILSSIRCFSNAKTLDQYSDGESYLESDIQRLVDLDIASYFTDDEFTTITQNKRIRREIRDIEYTEWKKIARAMNIMKSTDHQTGIAKYGDKFWNYDKLVCLHARIAWSKSGDMNHLNPSFGPWHRIYLLMFEESILSIDPTIEAIPYWDFRRDASEPLNSIVWTELYFGALMGDVENDYAITDGPFAYWPIHDNPSELGCQDVHNIWGQMRNPVMQEKSRYVTRMGSAFCNKTNTNIGTPDEWHNCINPASHGTYKELDACYEDTFHIYSHKFVGGTRASKTPHVIKSEDEYDSDVDSCLSWTGSIEVTTYGHVGYRFYAHPEYECFKCPKHCDIDDTRIECTSCKVASRNCSFELYDKIYTADIYSETEEYLWGDMADPITSPNDPFFWFHHINLDRFTYIWQLHLWDARPYYFYPFKGWEYGINLDDVAGGGEWPFTNIFEMFDHDKELTIRDIFDATTFVNVPYAYDDVVAALHRGAKLTQSDGPDADEMELEDDGDLTLLNQQLNQNANERKGVSIIVSKYVVVIGIWIIIVVCCSLWFFEIPFNINLFKKKNKSNESDMYRYDNWIPHTYGSINTDDMTICV